MTAPKGQYSFTALLLNRYDFPFEVILGNFHSILCRFGSFWVILDMLAYYGSFWFILGHFGLF